LKLKIKSKAKTKAQHFSKRISFSSSTERKTVGSPSTFPIIFTALAGIIFPSLLTGVGPKNIQKALPLGQ
jgi:hypothetical protein